MVIEECPAETPRGSSYWYVAYSDGTAMTGENQWVMVGANQVCPSDAPVCQAAGDVTKRPPRDPQFRPHSDPRRRPRR